MGSKSQTLLLAHFFSSFYRISHRRGVFNMATYKYPCPCRGLFSSHKNPPPLLSPTFPPHT